MKRILILVLAASALAVPATASAWFGRTSHALIGAVSGTGTSFASATATASGNVVKGSQFANGHFSLSLSTTWTSAKSHTFPRITVSCAPATATLTLTAGSTTKTLSLTGRTCSIAFDGTTRYGFMGRDPTTHGAAFLRENGTTVRGLVGAFQR
jgi:hypothetical protein